jgi:hypothetical protein
MNKKEACSLLKELLVECKMDSNSFILMEPIRGDPLADGYKIKINVFVDENRRQQLKKLTKKYDLAVIEEKLEIIVYKPKLNELKRGY